MASKRDIEIDLDFVVCVRANEGKRYFDDDKMGVCAKCGHQVRFRPYVPDHWPKLCLSCGLGMMQAESA